MSAVAKAGVDLDQPGLATVRSGTPPLRQGGAYAL